MKMHRAIIFCGDDTLPEKWSELLARWDKFNKRVLNLLINAFVLMDHARALSPWPGKNIQICLLPLFVLELIKFVEWLGRKESLFGAELMGRWDVIRPIMSLKNEFHWGVNSLSSIITRIQMLLLFERLDAQESNFESCHDPPSTLCLCLWLQL